MFIKWGATIAIQAPEGYMLAYQSVCYRPRTQSEFRPHRAGRLQLRGAGITVYGRGMHKPAERQLRKAVAEVSLDIWSQTEALTRRRGPAT
jgi:hypothetical protein